MLQTFDFYSPFLPHERPNGEKYVYTRYKKQKRDICNHFF